MVREVRLCLSLSRALVVQLGIDVLAPACLLRGACRYGDLYAMRLTGNECTPKEWFPQGHQVNNDPVMMVYVQRRQEYSRSGIGPPSKLANDISCT